MEARDEALRTLRARLETAEAELGRLRVRAEGEDERTLVGTLDAQRQIETAQKALALAEARYEEERRVLADAMQSLRERIAAETARARTAEQRWEAREQQYLIDLKEFQGLSARRDQDVGAAETEIRARDASLAEAKNALQKTLAELLHERKERERAHGEREAALKKVDELRAHVDELSPDLGRGARAVARALGPRALDVGNPARRAGALGREPAPRARGVARGAPGQGEDPSRAHGGSQQQDSRDVLEDREDVGADLELRPEKRRRPRAPRKDRSCARRRRANASSGGAGGRLRSRSRARRGGGRAAGLARGDRLALRVRSPSPRRRPETRRGWRSTGTLFGSPTGEAVWSRWIPPTRAACFSRRRRSPAARTARPRSPPAGVRSGRSTRLRRGCCVTPRRRRIISSPRVRAPGRRRPRSPSTGRPSGPTTRSTAR